MTLDTQRQTKSYTTADLDAASYASLTAYPVSQVAKDLCQKLADGLVNPNRQRATKKQVGALSAFIADLLERDPEHMGGWLHRSFMKEDFTAQAIGYAPFIAIYRPMKSAVMLEEAPFTRQYAQNEFTSGHKVAHWGRNTRFRPTPSLLAYFADQGISRETWKDHFERKCVPVRVKHPVELRAAKPPIWGIKYKKLLAPSSGDPAYHMHLERMKRLNEFLKAQAFAPFGPVALKRIFANGDKEGFSWDQGGRHFALGTSTYQRAKKRERPSITINGSSTVEIDIRASHLTIMAGLGHLPASLITSGIDPYAIDGLPRALVKQWVTMTLGHGKRHVKWPKGAKAVLEGKEGIDLSQFPLRSTGDLILNKLPFLDAEGHASVGWGILQYIESEAIMKAMEALVFTHGIASLPVFDSLIVPQQAQTLASSLLKEAFRELAGIECGLA